MMVTGIGVGAAFAADVTRRIRREIDRRRVSGRQFRGRAPGARADAEAVAQMDCDAVLLPKVESAAQLDALAEITGDLPIWAMMETPLGVVRRARHRRREDTCGRSRV